MLVSTDDFEPVNVVYIIAPAFMVSVADVPIPFAVLLKFLKV